MVCDIIEVFDFCDNFYIRNFCDFIFWNIRDVGDIGVVCEFWEINVFYGMYGVYICVYVLGLYSCEGSNIYDV